MTPPSATQVFDIGPDHRLQLTITLVPHGRVISELWKPRAPTTLNQGQLNAFRRAVREMTLALSNASSPKRRTILWESPR